MVERVDESFENLALRLADRPPERPLRVWWRDDDAARPTAALSRLVALSRASGCPLGLAVVPAAATDDLPDAIVGAGVTVLQHGFAHINHAAPGGRAVECGGGRETDRVMDELTEGRLRLETLFTERFAPIMVPPWNRIEQRIAERLPQAGYTAVSTFGDEVLGVPGLVDCNADIDILRWKGGAHFAGGAKLAALWCQELTRRETRDSPLCILSHHLAHDAASWTYLERLLGFLARQASVRFVDAPAACRLWVAA